MASTTSDRSKTEPRPPALGGGHGGVDTAYAVLMIVFTIAVLVQIYLAGAGAFAHHTGPDAVPGAFDAHEALGHYLGIASGLLFILALIARANRSTVIGALFLLLTTEVAQEGLASVGHDNRWIGGLHAFDAAVILLLAIWLTNAAYRRRLAPATR